MFFNPTAQCDQLVPGSLLNSEHGKYLIQSIVGRGTFSKVAICRRMKDNETVAIKMLKNRYSAITEAVQEIYVLSKLKKLDPDKCNLVRWYHDFKNQAHVCLVFEQLDKSLFDFMAKRHFQPLPMKEIRPIVKQLANALGHLRTVGLIHADLRLENVMLVNHQREPFKVKLIDFGFACDASAARLGSYIQSRPYRSPEIILVLPFTEAIDMWSLGCLAASLHLGGLLFPGKNIYHVMRYMVKILGQPPNSLLNDGKMTGRYFERDSTTGLWKLKSVQKPDQIFAQTGIAPEDTSRFLSTYAIYISSLDDLLYIWALKSDNFADKAVEMTDRLMFVDMLKKMLEFDATKRITPSQVLKHPFISMHHIVSLCPLSSRARSSFEIMDVCQKTSDYVKAQCRSLEQPSSTTTDPVQQNYPPPPFCLPPAHKSALIQPTNINPQPCTGTQTTTSEKSWIERRADDKDGNITLPHCKRAESGRKPPEYKVKTQDEEGQLSDWSHMQKQLHPQCQCERGDVHHLYHTSHPARSTQTESLARTSEKKVAAQVLGSIPGRGPSASHTSEHMKVR